MSTRADLLIEIGTQELPPKDLPRLAEAFRNGLLAGLNKAKLEPGDAQWLAAPRRLAVRVNDLLCQQPDQQIDRLGPAVAAAFKDGQPTQAALGFAKSCGVELDQIEHRETDKGVRLAYKLHEVGQPASALVLDLVEEALKKLPVAKPMRWNDHSFAFVRPVQWIVALLGNNVIDGELFGLKTGRESRGHRFHSSGTIHIDNAQAYAEALRGGHVMIDSEERKAHIVAEAERLAHQINGSAQIRYALLDEVANLVEWPVPFVGSFEADFLQVPQEALVSSMESHQKCFPVVDADGQLMPRFIGVANIESNDTAKMIEGFERVIRPRLADAQFFWNNDERRPLEEHRQALDNMVFQDQLGSLGDKVLRVAELAKGIAAELGVDAAAAERAAELAKCDLLTEMVFEFPDLQGIAGHRIAAKQGEPEAVAIAIEEQYLPKGAGDELPASTTGQVLALADRLDTLAGIFAAGMKPTGSKDPFALRRAGLGVVRIIVERELDLDLSQWLNQALTGVAEKIATAPDAHDDLLQFVMERLRAYYADQGISHDVFDAVWARRPTRLLDFHQRLQACRHFRSLDEAPALAAANKRIGNILRKAEQTPPTKLDPKLFDNEAEAALAAALDQAQTDLQPLLKQRSYQSALQRLSLLRPTIDRFFDEVMVMAEQASVRANRLALLDQIKALFDRIADVSKLEIDSA